MTRQKSGILRRKILFGTGFETILLDKEFSFGENGLFLSAPKNSA